jgi:hypothetical protein
MKNYTTLKKNFLSKLKNSPYSDTLIKQWMETFKDDSVCVQFLDAILRNNEQWREYKNGGVTISEWVDAIYNHYTQEQELPHNLAITILIGSCNDISKQFIAREAMKSVKVSQKNGITIFDMSN